MRTKNYLAPAVEMYEVVLESGIAQSSQLPGLDPGEDEDW